MNEILLYQLDSVLTVLLLQEDKGMLYSEVSFNTHLNTALCKVLCH